MLHEDKKTRRTKASKKEGRSKGADDITEKVQKMNIS